jgi:hypothetical protein
MVVEAEILMLFSPKVSLCYKISFDSEGPVFWVNVELVLLAEEVNTKV